MLRSPFDAAAGRSATFCTHHPQHCAEAPTLVDAATSPSLHIVNRHCDDGEEYLLLFLVHKEPG
jgi:hypothetical protein